MAFLSKSLISLFLCLLPLLVSSSNSQVYVVYLGEHEEEHGLNTIKEKHLSYLASVKGNKYDEAKESLIYSYKHINGFAAVLTDDQASNLSDLDEVVSVFENRPMEYTLDTTRSWKFISDLEDQIKPKLEMETSDLSTQSLLKRANYGQDVIVGVLDSGFWPESKSFNDENMGPVPKSWKGICQTGDAFNSSHCNRKVIGARYFSKGFERSEKEAKRSFDLSINHRSPRDTKGHGTHTASIVGGRSVAGASFLDNLANGTASGGAPFVRLAIYKVCWRSQSGRGYCTPSDMLAAMDQASQDGVHIISFSIGHSGVYKPFTQDGSAIGALHLLKRNIVVVASAGNEGWGPTPATLHNQVPWVITVGASSLDRKFYSPVVLGNGLKIEGETTTSYKMDNVLYPLAYGRDVALPNATDDAEHCRPNSLSSEKASGKIILCLGGSGIEKSMEVKRVGGIGLILGNSFEEGQEILVKPHVLPATAVDSDSTTDIYNYINSTKNPTAQIIPARTVLHTTPAPYMAAFTSRGPNTFDPDILKPDITAPGLSILAAWSEEYPPRELEADERRVKWNIDSGTSMACPHVSAAAAILKAIHPTWSSAAIRSALITTAGLLNTNGTLITDASGKPADPFQFGGGHLRPAKALDPGLVYDASYTDYIMYLCGLGIKGVEPSFECPRVVPRSYDLNHPSIAISKLKGKVTVKRTVTNVGKFESTYAASVKQPVGYKVKIRPRVLTFKYTGEVKTFKVSVTKKPKAGAIKQYEFGWIIWSDGIHSVKSPMVISSA